MSDGSSHHRAPPPTGSSIRARPTGGSSARAAMGDGQTVITSRPPVPDLKHAAVTGDIASMWEGEQLGQFVLQKFVGGGGMGIVFRAHDTTLDREVAVKVLSRDQSADEETLRRFRNEAQSAARLSHDNIARVFYVGEDRGVHYIVFEFIDGVNIRDLVEQQGPLDMGQALSYTYQIALALDHACQRSVIHRDIKPSNVLVTPDGKAKLVDMGLARLNQMAHATNDLTASGVTLGTFDYISPEQARDPRSADVRSDLYSLGCSLYFMLTGRPPFPEGTVLQKLLQHQADTPPDPRVLRPELPPQASQILTRLLAKNPADRYQLPAELLEDLIALGQALGLQLGELQPTRVTAKAPTAPAPWRVHVPWAVPVAALFLIVFLMDLYWSGEQTAPVVSQAANNGLKTPLKAPEVAVPKSHADDRGELSLPPSGARLPRAPGAEPAGREMPILVRPTPEAPSTDIVPRSPAIENESPIPATETREPVDRSRPAFPLPAADEDNEPDERRNGLGRFFGALGLDIFEQLRRESEIRAARARENTSGAGDLAARPRSERDPVSRDASLLTVGDENAPNNFNSLAAACIAAKDGDTIELRFNGRRQELPVSLSNVKVSIQAGAEYRPIVVFAPEPNKPFAIKQMVSISGGQLAVRNVHWELDLPADSPDERVLFESQHCDLLDFQNCTFTIRGRPPYYAGAAFFDVRALPGAGTMGMGVGAMDAHLVNIQLTNCVARGEATLLRDVDLQSVRLSWTNGLLATSERLVFTEGNSVQPPQEARAEIVLRHVTVAAASGLVLMTSSQEEPHQMVVDLRCHDCILSTRGSSAVVEQRGAAEIDEFLARFQWSGDNNFFAGFESFWRIMTSAGPTSAKQMDFSEWQERWRFTSLQQYADETAVVWNSLPADSRPYHSHTASDYALSKSASQNLALEGASSGADAGAPLAYLPALPETPNP